MTIERLTKIAKIEELQAELDTLRNELGISAKGLELVNDEIYDDRRFVVTADGLGGADLEYADGAHYPIDYQQIALRHYDSEEDATSDCARLSAAYQGEDPEDEEDEGKTLQDLIEEIFK